MSPEEAHSLLMRLVARTTSESWSECPPGIRPPRGGPRFGRGIVAFQRDWPDMDAAAEPAMDALLAQGDLGSYDT